jgi:dienelactone hydrolase
MALGCANQFRRPAHCAGGRSLKTPQEAVVKIHEMAGQYTYDDIADRLNDAGYRTVFGRLFTHYICRRDGLENTAQRERHPRPE